MGFESMKNMAAPENEEGRLFSEKMLDASLPDRKQAIEGLLANCGAQEDWLDSLNAAEQEEVRAMADELVEQKSQAAMPEVLARKRQIIGKFKVLINTAVDRSLEQAA